MVKKESKAKVKNKGTKKRIKERKWIVKTEVMIVKKGWLVGWVLQHVNPFFFIYEITL